MGRTATGNASQTHAGERPRGKGPGATAGAEGGEAGKGERWESEEEGEGASERAHRGREEEVPDALRTLARAALPALYRAIRPDAPEEEGEGDTPSSTSSLAPSDSETAEAGAGRHADSGGDGGDEEGRARESGEEAEAEAEEVGGASVLAQPSAVAAPTVVGVSETEQSPRTGPQWGYPADSRPEARGGGQWDTPRGADGDRLTDVLAEVQALLDMGEEGYEEGMGWGGDRRGAARGGFARGHDIDGADELAVALRADSPRLQSPPISSGSEGFEMSMDASQGGGSRSSSVVLRIGRSASAASGGAVEPVSAGRIPRFTREAPREAPREPPRDVFHRRGRTAGYAYPAPPLPEDAFASARTERSGSVGRRSRRSRRKGKGRRR